MRRIAIITCVVLPVLLFTGCGKSEENESTTTVAEETATTRPEVTSSSPTGPTVTASATSSTLPSDNRLVLYATGIGLHAFGETANSVVEAFTKELGSPSDDRIETAFSSSYGVCPGESIRAVEWGGFALLFTDGETQYAPADAEFTFFDWRLRDLGDATPPLTTVSGSQIGDSTADLQATHGNLVEVFEDELMGASFRIATETDFIRGTLTSTNADGIVVSLAAGVSCGE